MLICQNAKGVRRKRKVGNHYSSWSLFPVAHVNAQVNAQRTCLPLLYISVSQSGFRGTISFLKQI